MIGIPTVTNPYRKLSTAVMIVTPEIMMAVLPRVSTEAGSATAPSLFTRRSAQELRSSLVAGAYCFVD